MEVSCNVRTVAQIFFTEWMIHIFAHVVQLNSIQLKIGQFDTVPSNLVLRVM